MRTALAIVLAFAACKKSSAPEAKAEPVGSGSAVGSGIVLGAPIDLAADTKLRDEIITYTMNMVPLLAAWDGDCTKQIERMKQLEPLVQQIRDDEEKTAPGYDARIKQYMMAHKAEVVGKMEAAIAATKLTKPQLEAKEAEIKAKCTGQDYADETNKIGIMRKKSPSPTP
jgi:hypothetical protein